ncbi:unnamed protein product [Paramecium pentaurelia]|uniref:Uncharacterized protein n=1 Tax=Paramecium pentaurelia TaxID=43138 RepID=A0A8S1Y2H6_9CILI|nr:unnamed protein product [Paramecium pentaurelia]
MSIHEVQSFELLTQAEHGDVQGRHYEFERYLPTSHDVQVLLVPEHVLQFVSQIEQLDVQVAHQAGQAQQFEPDLKNLGKQVEQIFYNIMFRLQTLHPFQQALHEIIKEQKPGLHSSHFDASGQLTQLDIQSTHQPLTSTYPQLQLQVTKIVQRVFTQTVHQNKVDSKYFVGHQKNKQYIRN